MYVWNSEQLWDMAVLPKKAGEALKIASFTQLKVLLWMATNGQNGVDAAACAAALGGRVSEADCADALAFWEQEGVLTDTEAPAESPAPKKATPKASEKQQTAPAPTEVPQPAPVVKTLTPADTEKAKAKKKPVDQKEFLHLLHTVEARFGKTLSRTDQDRLLDLCEQTSLPMEVLVMILAYAVKNDKKRVSYIQTVARSFEEKGITTIDAADRYFCHLERREKAWEQVCEWLSLSIERPTVSQKDLAEKWIFEFEQTKPLLALAYGKCVEKTGTFQAAYMDRLLCAWHEDGITDPALVDAPKTAAKKKKKDPSAGGFDVEKYEKMIAGYTPRFRKKE